MAENRSIDGQCDGCSRALIFFSLAANLKQRSVIGTWNVRGFLTEKKKILGAFARKQFDICGIQETKYDTMKNSLMGTE